MCHDVSLRVTDRCLFLFIHLYLNPVNRIIVSCQYVGEGVYRGEEVNLLRSERGRDVYVFSVSLTLLDLLINLLLIPELNNIVQSR